jgi:hypothetical protein
MINKGFIAAKQSMGKMKIVITSKMMENSLLE